MGHGKYCSKNCFDIDQRVNPRHAGEAAYQWKDNPSYKAIHRWVWKHFKSSMICEICEKSFTSGRKINWANLSGQYKRERSDWARLCVPCHRKWDNHSEKMKENWKNGIYANRQRRFA